MSDMKAISDSQLGSSSPAKNRRWERTGPLQDREQGEVGREHYNSTSTPTLLITGRASENSSLSDSREIPSSCLIFPNCF